MAALNCVMLSPSGQPVPLPGEKFLFSSTPTVSLSLFPRPPGANFSIQPKKGEEYKAVGGTVHVSPRRIVYVAKDARPSVGPPSGDTASSSVGATASAGNAGVGSLASGSASNTSARTAGASSSQVTLATLSVPLRHFVDSHLVQPWLRATYLEALCVCSEDAEDLRGPHIARFYFKEGGGFEFYQAIDEVKARAEIGGRSGVAEEQLPAYSGGGPAASTPAATATPSQPGGGLAPPASYDDAPPPSPSMFAAAEVARAAEEEERRQSERAATSSGPARGPEEGEAPPGYAA